MMIEMPPKDPMLSPSHVQCLAASIATAVSRGYTYDAAVRSSESELYADIFQLSFGNSMAPQSTRKKSAV